MANANAGTGIFFFVVKFLKYFKNAIVKFGFKTNAIIGYRDVAVLLIR